MTCASATAPLASSAGASSSPACPASMAAAARSRSFYLLASVTVSFLAGSSAPTPLYPVYQALWGFPASMLALVFASYVAVLMAALLVFGRLSDHVGRRPVIVVAALMQVGAMAWFASAQGVADLFAGRIVQGLATGAAISAIGAGMLDLDRRRGTIANSVAPGFGTALGGVLAGVLVRYLPAPTLLVYVVLAAVYLLQAVGIAFLPEPGQRRAGAWGSLRPQFGTPAKARSALRVAVPILVAGWAFAGFYASLGPGLVHRVFGFDASLGGGIALFLLAGSAAVAVLVLHARDARKLLQLGASGLLLGVSGVIAALVTHASALFVVATLVAGVGFGTGFQGGVRSVLAQAGEAERARVLAVVFLVSYIAMGLPAVVAGWVAVRSGNLPDTAIGFAAAVLALAALAWRASSAGTRPRSTIGMEG